MFLWNMRLNVKYTAVQCRKIHTVSKDCIFTHSIILLSLSLYSTGAYTELCNQRNFSRREKERERSERVFSRSCEFLAERVSPTVCRAGKCSFPNNREVRVKFSTLAARPRRIK